MISLIQQFNIYFTASLLESDLKIVWLVSKEFGAEICIFFEKKKLASMYVRSSCEVHQTDFLKLVAMITLIQQFNIYFTASLLESDLKITWLVGKEV